MGDVKLSDQMRAAADRVRTRLRGEASPLMSIPANPDRDVDLLLDNGAAALEAAEADAQAMREVVGSALLDARAGWRYIREHHGDLYGVGWDRVEQKLTAALAALPSPPEAAKETCDLCGGTGEVHDTGLHESGRRWWSTRPCPRGCQPKGDGR